MAGSGPAERGFLQQEEEKESDGRPLMSLHSCACTLESQQGAADDINQIKQLAAKRSDLKWFIK